MNRPTLVRAMVMIIAAASVAVLGGCGTVVFDNRFAVVVDDPSGRLDSDRVEVSVFDPLMGDTADWAEQFAGVSTPQAPYLREMPVTDTKMVADSSPPRRVTAGVYLPQFDDTGYYVIAIDPVDGGTLDYEAGYVTYDYSWETSGAKRPTAPPLPMTITTADNGNGWDLQVEVRIPPR